MSRYAALFPLAFAALLVIGVLLFAPRHPAALPAALEEPIIRPVPPVGIAYPPVQHTGPNGSLHLSDGADLPCGHPVKTQKAEGKALFATCSQGERWRWEHGWMLAPTKSPASR